MNNAAKLLAAKIQSRKNASSKTAARIAVASIILSLMVVTLAMAVTDGFGVQIQQRIRTLTADYTLQGHDSVQHWIAQPIQTKSTLRNKLKQIKGVEAIYPVSTLNAVIQAQGNTIPLAVQGVDNDFPAQIILKPFITNGQILPETAKDSAIVIIPQKIAQILGKSVGDRLDLIIFSAIPIKLSATIHGTFATGLEEADKTLAFMPLETVALLRNQEPMTADQFNILVNKNAPTEMVQNLENTIADENILLSSTAERYPQVFDWIGMLQNNVTLILIIMIIVAAIAMTGAILAIILENTATIGLLKALGMRTRTIVAMFVTANLRFVVPSALVGVGLALVLAAIQSATGVITLDAGAYMLERVPVEVNVLKVSVLFLAAVAMLIVLSIVPTLIIARLQPVKCLKFS